MINKGFITDKIDISDIPQCPSCMIAKMKRKCWRSKTRKHEDDKTIRKPGELVVVEKFESPIPGLMGQMTGNTHTKYIM